MGIPALTVHDEFIVPVDLIEEVQLIRYTSEFENVW